MAAEREEIQQDSAAPDSIFVPAFSRYNKPSRIVTFGHYYGQAQVGEAKSVLREVSTTGYVTDRAGSVPRMRQGIEWTRLINALGKGRQWPLKRLFEQMDPMLAEDIAIAVVPPHIAYSVCSPVRDLARRLAANGRVDASSCLERHVTIRRIIFGGPSTRALHRQTIHAQNSHLIAGKNVLLLDDIAKSGASLIACREMLYEAGARLVQAAALGRLVSRAEEQ